MLGPGSDVIVCPGRAGPEGSVGHGPVGPSPNTSPGYNYYSCTQLIYPAGVRLI